MYFLLFIHPSADAVQLSPLAHLFQTGACPGLVSAIPATLIFLRDPSFSGNTVVIKPSEKTSLTALALGELIVKAGFPPGVINIVTGFGLPAGAALAKSNKVAKISFTGSNATGRAILHDAANSNLKKVSLELGGKSPVIVCADVNVDEAVEKAHQALFTHSGQVCVAGSRVFVQYEELYYVFKFKCSSSA